MSSGISGRARSGDRQSAGGSGPSDSDRIRSVYRSYMPTVRHRWDPDNPGVHAIVEEQRAGFYEALEQLEMLPLDRKRVLDVGCGSGPQLAFLLEFGARRENLVGIDLLPERVSLARENLPEVPLICADASGLPLADASFDLLLAFTMFSSVPTAAMASAIAAEMRRVLRPSGALVCYDLRVDNPWNPNVHRVSPAQLQMWFPEFAVQATSLTVLPPLARCLGRFAPAVYPVLSSVPFLRTHYLTRIQKPAVSR